MKLAASKSKYEDLLKHHDDSLIDKFLVIADDIRIINRRGSKLSTLVGWNESILHDMAFISQLECQQPTTSVVLPDTGNSPVRSGVTDIMPSVDTFDRTPAPVEPTTGTASPPLDSLSEFPPLQPSRRSLSLTGSLGDADSEYGSAKRTRRHN
ncbi:hypothetical protein J6590_097633 [Homalodisca vitripennis]|nr:hypothetical protein J6590_097633 [Homalodisca vitripennis]